MPNLMLLLQVLDWLRSNSGCLEEYIDTVLRDFCFTMHSDAGLYFSQVQLAHHCESGLDLAAGVVGEGSELHCLFCRHCGQ